MACSIAAEECVPHTVTVTSCESRLLCCFRADFTLGSGKIIVLPRIHFQKPPEPCPCQLALRLSVTICHGSAESPRLRQTCATPLQRNTGPRDSSRFRLTIRIRVTSIRNG